MDDDGGASVVLTIRVVAETGSTNADLLAAAAEGTPEATWLRAERQVAGRGRQGRPWSDGAGNLFASTIIRLRLGDPPAPTLALVAGVALAEAVGSVAPDLALLKWPNDLMVERAKLSGILLERGAGDAVIAGFGVNLAQNPQLPDRPTTSLTAHGVLVTASEMLDLLAARFATVLTAWRTGGVAAISARWKGLAHPVGTPLTVRLPDGRSVAGRFEDLDPSGALRLSLPGGGYEVVHAGDVFL